MTSASDDFMKKSPLVWTQTDVRDWLVARGCARWSDEIAFRHRVDGVALLSLREEDLRLPPLSIDCLGDIKRIGVALAELRSNNNVEELDRPVCSLANGNCVLSDEKRERRLVEWETSTDGHRRTIFISSQELIRRVESPDTAEKSMVKLALALVYCLFSLLVTSFVMVLVHDRVPNMKTYPPLPDIFLDNIPLIPWAFECCELIGLVMALFWMAILIFHKHRIVILRRMFSLTGSVFLLRCVTMLITSLSVPGIHLECRAYSYGNLWDKLRQAFHIWIHLGMSIQGVRTCGDYMFSGHTATITLLNHFITEYTPESWRGVHTLMWVLNVFGVFFILAGHEHYSIDVFVAFYITSRMFLSYHANAYNYASMASMDDRMRVWFPLGWFFESGAIGRLRNEFEIPSLFSRSAPKERPAKPATLIVPKLDVVSASNGVSSIIAATTINGDAKRRRKSKK